MSSLRRNMMALRSGGGVDWQTMYYGLVDGTLSGELLLPSGLTRVRDNLCYSFSGVTSVNFPDTITFIGTSAFLGTSLTSLSLPNSLTSIGTGAFRAISTLNTPVVITNSVTSLGGQCFFNCTNLPSVDVGSSVATINAQTFYNCSSLTHLIFRATTPPSLPNTNAFSFTNNCPIYVPDASVATYKAAQNWSTYADRIKSLNDFPT